MARYYQITATVDNFNKEKLEQIKEILYTKLEASDNEEDMLSFIGNLYVTSEMSFSTEEDMKVYINNLAKTIYRVNGESCSVEVKTLDLDNAPYEMFTYESEEDIA